MQKVGVEKGVEWIGTGFRIVRGHPVEFLLMSLIYTTISLVPFLGLPVIVLLGPALLGGMIHASREASLGHRPRVGQLFQAFQDGDRTGSYIALCLPYVAFFVALIILFFPLIAAIFHAAQSGQINPRDSSDSAALAEALRPIITGMLGSLMLRFLTLIALAFLVGMLTFLAAARIMLGHERAFAAMRSSFSACLRNFGAYFVLMLLLGMGMFIVRAILSLALPGVLVVLLTGVPFNALIGPIVYAAHCSIFGEDNHDSDVAPTPAAPAPSSHTFEA